MGFRQKQLKVEIKYWFLGFFEVCFFLCSTLATSSQMNFNLLTSHFLLAPFLSSPPPSFHSQKRRNSNSRLGSTRLKLIFAVTFTRVNLSLCPPPHTLLLFLSSFFTFHCVSTFFFHPQSTREVKYGDRLVRDFRWFSCKNQFWASYDFPLRWFRSRYEFVLSSTGYL